MQKLFIPNRFGEKLEALMQWPQKSGHNPAILLVPGLAMDLHEYKNSYDEIAGILNQAGFVTLQFSFAGCGKSEGDFRNMTLSRQANQIEDLVSWLKTNDAVDPERIGIIAQSFGVPSVMRVQKTNAAPLCFVSGVYFLDKRFKQLFSERKSVINPEGDSNLPRTNGTVTVFGKQFWPDLSEFDPLKYAGLIKSPVFIIHGSLDSKTTDDEVRQVFSFINGRQKKLQIFPGGDHGIIDVPGPMREEFLHEVLKWFKETL